MLKIPLNIAATLFSKVRQRVIEQLYSNPDIFYHTNEIIRLTSMGTGYAVFQALPHTNAFRIRNKFRHD